MNMLSAISGQILQSVVLIILAPILLAWINQNRAWLNNKKGAGLLQCYRNLRKLFIKEPVLADNASFLFRSVPYFYFAAMVLVTAIVPVLSSHLPFARAADVIALVGIFSLARVLLALAAMDIGTAFGDMGARREMLVAFLAEPALLMIFLNAALISQSTSLTTIIRDLELQPLIIYPSIAFAAVGFVMVLLAENARIPVDNPTTHLELTMIHEAMILEYSGRHLALIEWASALKLLNYFVIGIALFFPWGIAQSNHFMGICMALMALLIKLFILGSGLTLLETLTAKIRIFRVPEFLTGAFVLAILGILMHLLWMKQ